MKNLLLIITILISSVVYGQPKSTDSLSFPKIEIPSQYNEDSVKYYFVQLVNEEKFRIGKVFEGKVKESYVRKPWQKSGKFVYDTLWGEYIQPQKLVLNDTLTLAADYQCEYLGKLNAYNKKWYISHFQEIDVEGWDELGLLERPKHFGIEGTMDEGVCGNSMINYHNNPNLNKMIAEDIFDSYYRSKVGHKETMLDPEYTKVGISIKFIENSYGFLNVMTYHR